MRFELELPRGLDSAAVARHALTGLGARLPEDQLGDVRLMVSELVTNAIRHGGADDARPPRLELTNGPAAIRVEVWDPGPGFPRPDVPAPRPEGGGNGLLMVNTIATRWGVDAAEEGGTHVWFEIDRAADGQPRDA